MEAACSTFPTALEAGAPDAVLYPPDFTWKVQAPLRRL